MTAPDRVFVCSVVQRLVQRLVRGAGAVAAALLLGLLATTAGAAPPDSPQGEIDHLLAYVEFSGCEFKRNGSWYTAVQAQAHLRDKLAIQNRNRPVLTAEDFIERVASRSAFTNIAYRQRCAGGPEIDVGGWLGAELLRFRQCRASRELCMAR